MSDGCTDAARGYHCKPATKKRKEPKRPKGELPDGLYLIQGSDHPFQALKKDGKWIPCIYALRMDNPETTDLSSVICRIPTEPIDGGNDGT